MPTIDQLAPATSAADSDEFIVSQGGIARKITRAQVLNGVQPQISVPVGTLLGGVATGNGTPSAVTVGANLVLSGATLSATAAPFSLGAQPAGTVPAPSDLIAMAQNGTNVAVTYRQLLSGISAAGNVDVSLATVRPNGAVTAQPLSTLIADLLPVSGGSLTGTLSLATNPLKPLDAASKGYVDERITATLPLTGGSMSGELLLAGPPLGANDAATKAYVDTASATRLSIGGGSLGGPLVLAGDPTSPQQAATKQYADLKLSRAGDSMTGTLVLASAPAAQLDAATKGYVDGTVATSLPLAGGTMLGAVLLASDPTFNGQAATKQYVDQRVLRAGDTLTGSLTLVGNPTQSLHAASKGYVDGQIGTAVARGGSSMTGALLLASDPATALQAATKQYADTKISRNGDSLTGYLVLNAAPAAGLHAATKAYVDNAVLTGAFQSGGSFGGMVYLAGDPVAPLQAVTKRYSDTHLLRTGDTLTGALTLAGDPSAPYQAATKGYVDAQSQTLVSRAGASLTGSLYLSADPTVPLQASTKHYVDAAVGTALPLAGGSLTGILSLAGAPQAPAHAATKLYVDGQIAGSLAQAGGSMAGPLTLAGAPTTPLQAATKSYVDANPNAERVINVCLPPYNAKLDGTTDDTAAFKAAYEAAPAGSVIYVPNGTTVLQQPGGWGVSLTKRVKWVVDGTVLPDGTPLATAIPTDGGPASLSLPGFVAGNSAASVTTSQSASQPTDFAVQHSAYIVNHTGGTPTVITNTRADTIIYNSPANFVWNGLDRLIWAGIQTPDGSAPAQHVSRYIQAVRQGATTGPQGQQLPQPQIWAACLEYRDATGQPSSITGASLTVEMDWFGNGLDDANTRTIQSLVVGQANTSGPAVEISNVIGVWLNAGASGSAKTIFAINLPFSSAVLDTTNAQQINNAPVLRMAAGQAIAFEAGNTKRLQYDSVTNTLRWYDGIMSFPVGRGITVGWQNVFGSSTNVPAYIAGNILFLVGSSPFTLTLPAASTVAAGTGFTFSALGAGPVGIVPLGQDSIDAGPITLHTNDRYHIVSDGAGAWREIFRTNAVSPYFSGPIVLPSYTVATLPGGMSAGAKAFASNGLKPGEPAGAGTGVEVFFDGRRWISSCSGTPVSA